MSYKIHSIKNSNKDIKGKIKEGPRCRRKRNKMLRRKIINILRKLGIPASIEGYHYIREAVLMSISNQETISEIVKSVYTKIANEHNSNKYLVERTIKTAVKRAINNGDIKIIQIYLDIQ